MTRNAREADRPRALRPAPPRPVRCVNCGYALTTPHNDAPELRCPECGHENLPALARLMGDGVSRAVLIAKASVVLQLAALAAGSGSIVLARWNAPRWGWLLGLLGVLAAIGFVAATAAGAIRRVASARVPVLERARFVRQTLGLWLLANVTMSGTVLVTIWLLVRVRG